MDNALQMTPSRWTRVLNTLSAKTFGTFLKYSIIILWALHCNLFGCCGYVGLLMDRRANKCGRFDEDGPGPVAVFSLIWIALGPVVTADIVVFLVNSVGDSYDEIQSWQIAYITWGSFCTIIFGGFITLVFIHHFGDADYNDVMDKLVRWLLYPFGIKPRRAEHETVFWTVPLVSLAPAMVLGFLANFILEPKYVFECDESYGPIADPDSCFNDGAICCIAISSHSEPLAFMASLASTILAAWGVVKIIGYFICFHDDDIVVDDDETEKAPQLMKDALSSSSSASGSRSY